MLRPPHIGRQQNTLVVGWKIAVEEGKIKNLLPLSEHRAAVVDVVCFEMSDEGMKVNDTPSSAHIPTLESHEAAVFRL